MCDACGRWPTYIKAKPITGMFAMINRTAFLIAATLALAPLTAQAESAVTIPPPPAEAPAQGAGLETAVLAGGCFWGIQAV